MLFSNYIHDNGQFCYRSLDSLYRRRTLSPNRRVYLFEQFLLLSLSARMVNLIVPYMDTNVAYTLDALQRYIAFNKNLYGVYFEIVSAILPLYCFSLRYLLNSVPEKNMCWSFFYDIAVYGTDVFDDCLRSKADVEALVIAKEEEIYFQLGNWKYLFFFIPDGLVRSACRTMAQMLLKLTAADVDRAKVMKRPLRENPTMSFELRARLVLLVWICNKISVCFFSFTCK